MRPGDGSLNCPDQLCLTIEEYAENALEYFTDRSTFVFLAGNHSLRILLSLTNTHNVTLTGEASGSYSTIVCESNANIWFLNASHLKLEQLTFDLLFLEQPAQPTSLLSVVDSVNVKVDSVLFRGNGISRFGAISISKSNVIIENSAFKGNCRTEGGAISAYQANITLNGNYFVNNRAQTNSVAA